MADPYLQHSGVMKNRLGLQDTQAIEAAETEFINVRLLELRQGIASAAAYGRFDTDHLKAIHHHLFQDIYEWSGVTRADPLHLEGKILGQPQSLYKGNSVFTSAQQVDTALNDLFEQLRAQDHLQGLARGTFCQEATQLLAKLNGIHPFREGNGRTQREFLTQLSEQAGHRLDFSVISQERMIVASIEAHHGDQSSMERMINEISDPSRVELLEQAIVDLEQQRVNWSQIYLATTEEGQEYQGRLLAHTSTFALVQSQGDLIVAQASDVSYQEQVKFHATAILQEPYQRGVDLDF